MIPAVPLAGLGAGDAWIGLARLAAELARDRGWVFRGVRRASHGLKPSVGRSDARKSLADRKPLPDCRERELQLIAEFRRHRFAERQGLDDVAALALGQHHRLVTRLLDWLQSLFVAAYFAVEHGGDGTTEDAAVYGLRGVADMEGTSGPFEVPCREVRLYRPPHMAPRVIAQRGLFTVHGSPDLDFHPAADADVELREWLVPHGANMRLKVRLDAAGINRASLFPDLGGVAEHLSWLYKRDLLYGEGGPAQSAFDQ